LKNPAADGAGAFINFAPNNNFGIDDYAGWVGLNSSAGGYDTNLVFGTYKSGVGSAERMRIDNNGNVGINTTSPRSMLDKVRGVSSTQMPETGTTAVQFSGSINIGTFAANGTMLKVGLADTYTSAVIHLFSMSSVQNGGGSSGVLGTYDIITLLSDDGGNHYNITRIGNALDVQPLTPVLTLSGSFSGNDFTLNGTGTSGGQSTITFYGYMITGGQAINPGSTTLTTYDGGIAATYA